MPIKECVVCGKSFEQKRITQRFCSAKCRRYANRHDELFKHEEEAEGAPVLWSFSCVKCGKLVRVTSPNDRRTKFCSRRCEKLYWKHSRYVESKPVAREFDCRTCGKHIVVTEPKDHRRFFCSEACSVEWFIKRATEKQRAKTLEKRRAREEAKKNAES